MIGAPSTMTRPALVSSRTGPQAISLLAWPVGAAHQRAQARQHFLHVEGLGDIIVGAGVKALHLVAPAVARGEDQHRHLRPALRQSSSTRDAVHLRQADVEHDGVIGLGLAEEPALLAVEGAIDGIARLLQRL